MKWRKITTAPRNGKRILLGEDEGRIAYAGEWDEETNCWASYCGQPVAYTPEPELWAPLPPSPPPIEVVIRPDARSGGES